LAQGCQMQRRVRTEEVPLHAMMYGLSRPRQLSPMMHHCSHSPPRSNVTIPAEEIPPRSMPPSRVVAGRRPERDFAETTPFNMPRSRPVSGRRPEGDLQRQVQEISTSHAPCVPSVSEDRSPERDQASVGVPSTASFSVSVQSTQQSVGKLAEGLEEKFTRRLALVEQDLNQKLGKLVEVTTALSLVWDERFAGLESRLSTNGQGVHPPSGSVASVDAPHFSHVHGKLLDMKCALPVQDFNAEVAELREKLREQLREQRVEFETAFQGLQSDLLLLNFRMEELRVSQEVVEPPSGPPGDGRVVSFGKGRPVAAPVCQHSSRQHPPVGPESPGVRESVAQGCLRNLSHSTRFLPVQPTATLTAAQCCP